jgi:hypothetical protein
MQDASSPLRWAACLLAAHGAKFRAHPRTMRVAVLNIVGLSESLLGVHTPGLAAFARE